MLSRVSLLICFSGAIALQAQSPSPPSSAGASNPPEPEHKRLFGIIPNYRTTPLPAHYEPLTAGEKFKLATQDAFDRGTFLLAGAFAGQGQLTNNNPSFGQGTAGYARRFGTSFADWAIGDYMTGAIYPVMLHQDPRYFRLGTGSGFHRLTHAMKQIFWTRTDSGGHAFNCSEVCGNATAVAISQAYYPDNRTASNAVGQLGIQLGVDMASNIMKEFYPDLRRKLSKKKHAQNGVAQH
jgi:hypothetical protein